MHTEALAMFKQLIAKYGTRWDVLIPPEAHAQLARCNKVLSVEDRKPIVDKAKAEGR